MDRTDITLLGTSPQSKDVDASACRDRVAAVARWSEEAGFSGILVYADNGLVDPWLVSQLIVENTKTLSPLSRFSLSTCTHIAPQRWWPPLAVYMGASSTSTSSPADSRTI